MSLTGKQAQALNAALLDAFRSRSALEQMVFYGMGIRLDEIAGGNNLTAIVFDLVRWAEAHGRVLDLITGARASNSTNHALRAFAASYLGDTTPVVPSTPTPQESTPVTDYSTRPIHAAHETGFDAVLAESASLTGPHADRDAAKLRRRIFAPGTTYAELANPETFDRAAVDRAVDRLIADGERPNATPEAQELAEHLRELPSSRNGEIALALRLVTPSRRHCPKCGRLDLQRAAGRWSPQTGDYCLARVGGVECRGMFASVAFDPDVVSWVDGSPHAPGTTHAPDGTPLTDDAIRAWVMQGGGAVSPWTTGGLAATQGALTLTDLAGYLLRTGMVRNALGALDALADPRRAQVAATPDAMVILCRKALASRAPMTTPAPAATQMGGGAWDAARRKRLRDALATLFSTPARVAEQCGAAGINTERVSLQGAPVDMWFSAISEAERAGRLDALLAVALAEYPRSFVLSGV